MKPEDPAESGLREEMSWGKTLVDAGTVASIAGIALYCKGAFLAGLGQQDAQMLIAGWGVIGFGGLLLLIGSFKYLTAVDHDLPGSSF